MGHFWLETCHSVGVRDLASLVRNLGRITTVGLLGSYNIAVESIVESGFTTMESRLFAQLPPQATFMDQGFVFAICR